MFPPKYGLKVLGRPKRRCKTDYPGCNRLGDRRSSLLNREYRYAWSAKRYKILWVVSGRIRHMVTSTFP